MDASQLYRMLVFATVVEQGSFTKAADKLLISRSMVSQHLKKLEQRLDNKLLERTTRRVRLTDSGRQFYQYCAELLQLAEQAEATAMPASEQLQGNLKICVPVAIGQRHILPKISEFTELYPKLKLNLLLDDNRRNLQEQHIDLAIYTGAARGTTNADAHNQWQHLKLANYREILVASPDYISRHGRPVHPDNLPQHQWICLASQLMPRQMLFYNSNQEEFRTRVTPAMGSNQVLSLLEMAVQGLGIISIAEQLLENEITDGKLERLLPDYHLNEGGIYLTHRFDVGMPPKARAFADFLSYSVYE